MIPVEINALAYAPEPLLLTLNAPVQQPGFASTLPLLLAIGAIFYFLLIRPQQKQVKSHETLVSGLKRGDKIVTGSGLHGRVGEVREHTFLLEIAKDTKVVVDRDAIRRKVVAADANSEPKDK
jgi:preprotein translocase subunit YajC